MSQVKIAISGMTDEEVLTLTDTICNCMKNNPNFTDPNPPLLDLTASVVASRALINGALQAHDLAKQKTTEKKLQMTVTRELLMQMVTYVQNASGGDAVKIESAGMQVRKKPTPVGPLSAPTMLTVKTTPTEGQMLITWKSVKNAASYEVQQINGSPTANWEVVGASTRGKCTVSGLTVGAQYTFRVRALGAAGFSAWSEQIVKKAA